MKERNAVPFDAWSLKVEVKVSQLISVGGYSWSCGQCPLGMKGEVLSESDLVAQTEITCDYIEKMLARTGLGWSSVSKLKIYYVDSSLDNRLAMMKILEQRTAGKALLMLISVPHFYYDGMMIEIDVFANQSPTRLPSINESGIFVEAIQSKDLTDINIRIPDVSSVSQAAITLNKLLQSYGLASDRLLSDHWCVQAKATDGRVMEAMSGHGLITNPRTAVMIPDHSDLEVVGSLRFYNSANVSNQVSFNMDDQSEVFIKIAEPFVWISVACYRDDLDIIEQTRINMSGLNDALDKVNMTFDNVVKLTTYYAGGATPEELHQNLQIRHSFYGDPSPASTGLPVYSLLDKRCKITTDIVAMI